MVIKDDPTLMFNNAGMNPFKDFFGQQPGGASTPPTLCTVCASVASTKRLGRGRRGHLPPHHVRDARQLVVWRLLQARGHRLGVGIANRGVRPDKDRLYVTVFAGTLETAEGRGAAYLGQMGSKTASCSPRRRTTSGKWANRPCGPFLEIHIDLRGDADRAATSGASLVNADHPRSKSNRLTQFNRMADGSCAPPEQAHRHGHGLRALGDGHAGQTIHHRRVPTAADRVAALSGSLRLNG